MRLRPTHLVLALLLVACGGPPLRTATPGATPRALTGTVELPSDLRGALVISWLTPDELADPERAFDNVMVGVERATVLRAEGGSVPFELRVPEGVERAQVAVWLDAAGEGLGALFVPPVVSEIVDPRTRQPVEIALEHREPQPRVERCAGERLELLHVDAPRGTAGGEPQVRLCVMLPRAMSGRLPVIYALPGLAGPHTNGSAVNARALLDASAPETGRDAIVVGVENTTPFGSSYLIDSPLTGAWGDFLAERVVSEIDRRYPTIAAREGRAVIGHSTGGFDAVTTAFRHPDVFGVIAASSPDALDFEAWMLDDTRERARPLWHAWLRFEDRLGGMGQFASYASVWSPEEGAPRGFRWPIDLESGAVVDDVWARWRAQSPITWLDDPERLEVARRFDDRLFLTCGRRDEAGLFDPTERYSEALRRAGVEHAWVPTDYRHIGSSERFAPLVEYVMARLAR